MNNDVRCKQRFQNFEKAYLLLCEVVEDNCWQNLSALEKEGLVQRFEMLLELSWKVLKDYLENRGYDNVKNATQTIRQSFQDEIITNDDAEKWMEALENRNLTSHTYNEAILERMFEFITGTFYPLVRDLYYTLKKEL